LYVFSWLFLGAYIFQNLATGVMVSNYQVIRQNMDAQAAKAAETEKQQANVDDLVDRVLLSVTTIDIMNIHDVYGHHTS